MKKRTLQKTHTERNSDWESDYFGRWSIHRQAGRETKSPHIHNEYKCSNVCHSFLLYGLLKVQKESDLWVLKLCKVFLKLKNSTNLFQPINYNSNAAYHCVTRNKGVLIYFLISLQPLASSNFTIALKSTCSIFPVMMYLIHHSQDKVRH